jgi:succinylglutamate desuccinylase
MNDKSIIKIEGEKSGKTVAIFCGVHGNELAGIMTVDYLIRNLKIEKGVVYLVYANPVAIKENVRFTEKNLNRCFLEDSIEGKKYEEKRATELMKILDNCDALLDLHAYNEPLGESIPFAICEKDCLDIVKNFDVDIVLTNIDEVEKGGTDGYMYNKEKIGICVELGAIENPENFVPLGIKTAYQFLQYFDLVERKYSSDKRKQKILRTSEIYKKKNSKFKFTKDFKTFDLVKKGETICFDGDEKVVSTKDKYILFPRDMYDVGVEAYLCATEE